MPVSVRTGPGAYVSGRFVKPRDVRTEIESVNPGRTTDIVGRFPVSDAAVDDAVTAARDASPAWSGLPQRARSAVLRRFARLVRDEGDGLARLITREMGKPLWEARQEVALVARKVEVTLGPGLHRVQAFTAADGGECRFRPQGILAVLGPFNFPVHLPNGHIVPALAVGNTVVFKPSETTPAVGLRYARLLHRAGCPRGVFNMVVGDGRTGEALARHPGVDGVLFTGSSVVGQRLAARLAETPGKLLALEMGGKNAAVVLADADLRRAVRDCLFGAFVTAGQRCTSTSRIVVARSIAGPFIDAFVAGARKLVVGYGLDRGVFMGPLATKASLTRFGRARAAASTEGAEVLLQADKPRLSRRGFYTSPSVHLVGTLRAESAYQDEEIFGPDVAIYVAADVEEAVTVADRTRFGLALSVFTRRRRNLEPFVRVCRVGVLNWNCATVGASGALPFGGQRLSGNGRPSALFATDYCTYPVAMLKAQRGQEPPPPPGFVRS
jgi:succinylglutamic semialdehyde dehydrogenase